MSQAPSSEMVHAMRVAEWKAEAALTGEPWYRVMIRAHKASMPAKKLLDAADVWDDLGDQVRDIVLATATDRPLRGDSAWRIRWDQLTEVEKISCGVLVRELHRKTARGECLR